MGFIISLFIFLSTIWVYLDATKRNIGRVKGVQRSFNWSAWEWIAGMAIIWIVFFPLYLYKRDDLIDFAKDHPVYYRRRAFGAFIIAVVCFGLFVFLNIPQ